MKKINILVIDSCNQCSWKRKGAGDILGPYFCGHPKADKMNLTGLTPIHSDCPLDDVVEEDIVEPGC